MKRRAPPALATWTLKYFGGRYNNESLIGDSLEEYSQGRSTWWYWRQVLGVIAVRLSRLLGSSLWITAVRIVGHLLIEMAVVLMFVELAQEWRYNHSFRTWASAGNILGFAVLVAMAVLGSVAWLWAHKRREDYLVRSLIVLLAVTMGAGALVWTGTTQAQTCAHKCACQDKTLNP